MTLWEATPLPRGRHGLPREDVAFAQRERIFAGLIQAVAERGYGATPVAEIIGRAGVSRETFYQQFSSKQECFLQCLHEATSTFITLLSDEPIDEELPPLERFGQLLDAYLTIIANDPDRARVFMVEVYAAGHEAIVARTGIQDLFTEAMMEQLGAVDRFAGESLVAAIAGRVTTLLASGDSEAIRELAPAYVELAEKMLLT